MSPADDRGAASKPPPAPLGRAMRLFWLTLGCLALVLAILGVVLPLLPTTPFLLVAAFAFAQSSERVHRWLIEHRHFGSLIADWQREGAIARRAKFMAVIAMAAVFVVSIVAGAGATVLIVQGIVLTLSGTFVVTRPSPGAGKAE